MRTLPPVIESDADLPPIGQLHTDAQERDWLEFKKTMSAPDMQDLAVHTASFANRLGGVILVGADLTGGVLAYPGIATGYAVRLKENFECAAKEWCHPVVDVRPVVVALPGSDQVLLAANVTAHIGGIIGVNHRLGEDKGARDPNAWLFPYRVGSHTKYAPPSELPMFFDLQSRTAALRLLRIPPKGHVRLFASPRAPKIVSRDPAKTLDPGGPLALASHDATIKEVSLDKNRALFVVSTANGTAIGDRLTAVPLRDVSDVWQGGGLWCVRVRGRIISVGSTADAYEPVLE